MKGKNILQLEKNKIDVSEELLSAVCLESTGMGKETEDAWLINTEAQIHSDTYSIDMAKLNSLTNNCLVAGFSTLMILKKPVTDATSSSNGL